MTGSEFRELLNHLDALVARFETHPDPNVSAHALELMRHVDAVHREALERLAGLVSRRDPALFEDAARDPIIGVLLALYDLAPAPPTSQAFVPLERLAASAAAARAREQSRP
jgi:hypothetical protein